MKKTLFIITLLLGTQYAFANSFEFVKCQSDRRSSDGSFISIEFSKNSAGKYDVYYEQGSAWSSTPNATKVLIATNLTRCDVGQTDSMIFTCFKSSKDEGDKTNTNVSSRLISTTSVLNSNGDLQTRNTLSIKISSPQLEEGKGKAGFPLSTQGSIYNTEFLAGSSATKLEYCEAR